MQLLQVTTARADQECGGHTRPFAPSGPRDRYAMTAHASARSRHKRVENEWVVMELVGESNSF